MKVRSSDTACLVIVLLAVLICVVPVSFLYSHPTVTAPTMNLSRGELWAAPSAWSKFFFDTNVSDVVIAIFTVVMAWSTIELWKTTKKTAEQAEVGLRTLERAYLFPEIEFQIGQQIAEGIDRAISLGDPEATIDLLVAYHIKNFGKTVATLTSVEATLAINDGGVYDSQPQLPGKLTIGSQDKTDQLLATCKLRRGQAADILFSEHALLFTGFVNYLDVWGDPQGQVFVWRYNHRLRRFVAIKQPAPVSSR